MTVQSLLVWLNRTIWSIAGRVPFVKPVLLILNSYVWLGNPNALLQFAPFAMYLRRFVFRFAVTLTIAWAVLKFGPRSGWIRSDGLNFLDLAISIFPNVLGFGIGAYALLFTFPERFFPQIEERRESKKLRVGAHGLNAITAFPLLAIALIILCCAVTKAIDLSPRVADTIGLFGILYGMTMTMEVIAVLFVSARKVIRNSLQQPSAIANAGAEPRRLPPSRWKKR
jgi:hypothetical protein